MLYKIHTDFKLNGISYDENSLLNFALKSNDIDFLSFISKWFDEYSFIEIQTSGTTGVPKIIKINKLAMVNSAKASALFFDLKSNDKVLNCLPIKYIAGKMMMVRAMVLGFDLDMVLPTSNPLEENKKVYDFIAMVPLQVENSIKELDNVKKLIIGGATVSKSLENKLIACKTEIYETYSLTETVTHIAAKRLGDKAFRTLPSIYINQDERGCLVIDAPELNSEKLITNDIIDIISETEFIWLGRYDNVINSGGIKLFPEQIEKKLANYIKNKYIVIGIPDAILGEKVILAIEGDNFNIPSSVFSVLEKYEKPKEIIFLCIFPETETGKIKRNEIKKLVIKKLI